MVDGALFTTVKSQTNTHMFPQVQAQKKLFKSKHQFQISDTSRPMKCHTWLVNEEVGGRESDWMTRSSWPTERVAILSWTHPLIDGMTNLFLETLPRLFCRTKS